MCLEYMCLEYFEKERKDFMVIRRTTMASNSSVKRTTAYDQSVGYRRMKVGNQNAASKRTTTYNQNTVSTSSKSTKTSTSSRYPVTYSSNNSSKPLTVNVTSKGVALNKSGKFFDDPVDNSKKDSKKVVLKR